MSLAPAEVSEPAEPTFGHCDLPCLSRTIEPKLPAITLEFLLAFLVRIQVEVVDKETKVGKVSRELKGLLS